MKACRRLP